MDYYESKNPQYLIHYGVLDMKWGRRKRRDEPKEVHKFKTKSGEELTLERQKTPKIVFGNQNMSKAKVDRVRELVIRILWELIWSKPDPNTWPHSEDSQ